MDEEEIKRALSRLGVERFMILGEEKTVLMPRREYLRAKYESPEEFSELMRELRSSGWKIDGQREYIPLLI